MDLQAATVALTRICAKHPPLRGALPALHRFASRRGYRDLMRENALRLLERAHVERLTGVEDAQETAIRALDRFEDLAAHGDPEAVYRLAEAHRTGFGRPGNHWKAVEHYTLAAELGHPGASLRLERVREGEAVPEEDFGRQALLRATYGRTRGEERLEALGAWWAEIRREGVGRRGVTICLGAALILGGYLALDVYFFGMGHWRPDPTRVVWGLFGKVHPPRGSGLGRVLPGWLRPDARSVTFHVNESEGGRGVPTCIGDFRGQVLFLHVVDGYHPALHESVAYLRDLDRRHDPALVFRLLYVPRLEPEGEADFAIRWALEIAPALPEGPKALRPLGKLGPFPMNFVIDRKGRIRQRWAGFSEALTEEALREALAEAD